MKRNTKMILTIGTISLVLMSIISAVVIIMLIMKNQPVTSINDKSLLKELKGTIVFQSDRVKDKWPIQLFKVDFKSLKVNKLSVYDKYDENAPRVIKDKVYFLLSLTSDQVGKLNPSIQGIYLMNIDGSDRKKILGYKNLSFGTYSIYSNSIAFEAGERESAYYDIYLKINSVKKILSVSEKEDYDLEKLINSYEMLIRRPNKKATNKYINEYLIYNTRTKDKKIFLPKEWDALDPSISPDGKKIVFTSSKNELADLYTMNMDGTGLKRLTFDRYPNAYPSWSPDGKYIVYSSTRDGDDIFGDYSLHVITADGKRHCQITEWNNSNDTNPTWTYSE